LSETFEVAVVGGGVIGCSIALRLASEGRRVVLIERSGKLGSGASSAALGGIIVETDDFCLESDALTALAAYSREILPDWVNDISRRSGHDVPILTTGDLQVALSETEQARLENVVLPRWRRLGYDVRPLSRTELRAEEPLLTGGAVAGYLWTSELALEPPRLMAAFRRLLANEPNVHVRLHGDVVKVDADATGASVTLRDGTVHQVGTVVVAAGHRTGEVVPEVGQAVFPVRGQAFELAPPDLSGYPIRHHCFAMIDDGGEEIVAYAVPRSDGRMAVGVTYEAGVAEVATTTEGQALVERGLRLLLPEAASWRVTRRWAGIRPGTRDGIPLVGRFRPRERLIVAAGHHGLGVTLAPATAELVAALVADDVADHLHGHLATCAPAPVPVQAEALQGVH
jgi:glycine oxidase